MIKQEKKQRVEWIKVLLRFGRFLTISVLFSVYMISCLFLPLCLFFSTSHTSTTHTHTHKHTYTYTHRNTCHVLILLTLLVVLVLSLSRQTQLSMSRINRGESIDLNRSTSPENVYFQEFLVSRTHTGPSCNSRVVRAHRKKTKNPWTGTQALCPTIKNHVTGPHLHLVGPPEPVD